MAEVCAKYCQVYSVLFGLCAVLCAAYTKHHKRPQCEKLGGKLVVIMFNESCTVSASKVSTADVKSGILCTICEAAEESLKAFLDSNGSEVSTHERM